MQVELLGSWCGRDNRSWKLKARIKMNNNLGGRPYRKIKSLIFLKRYSPTDKVSVGDPCATRAPPYWVLLFFLPPKGFLMLPPHPASWVFLLPLTVGWKIAKKKKKIPFLRSITETAWNAPREILIRKQSQPKKQCEYILAPQVIFQWNPGMALDSSSFGTVTRETNLSQFTRTSSRFSTESPTSREIYLPWANPDDWSPHLYVRGDTLQAFFPILYFFLANSSNVPLS